MNKEITGDSRVSHEEREGAKRLENSSTVNPAQLFRQETLHIKIERREIVTTACPSSP
jgi:hypothetical protein